VESHLTPDIRHNIYTNQSETVYRGLGEESNLTPDIRNNTYIPTNQKLYIEVWGWSHTVTPDIEHNIYTKQSETL